VGEIVLNETDLVPSHHDGTIRVDEDNEPEIVVLSNNKHH
jgi:hypothetical protein